MGANYKVSGISHKQILASCLTLMTSTWLFLQHPNTINKFTFSLSVGTVQVTTALSAGLVSPLIRFPQTMRGQTRQPPITKSHRITRNLPPHRRTDLDLLQSHEQEIHLGILKVCQLVNLPWLIPISNKVTCSSTLPLERRSTRRRSTSTRRKRRRRKIKRRKRKSVIKRRAVKSR